MAPSHFPDPETYDFPEWVLLGDYFYPSSDIVSFGDDLSVGNVIDAYRNGIFPWNIEGIPLPWYCPRRRAILEFSRLHVPKSLEKLRRRQPFKFTIDRAFRAVIEACAAAVRKNQPGTWITTEFIDVYCELHFAGVAHSVEAWNKEGTLAGGLYGVDAGGVFCGESMFYTETGASKLSLLFLIEHLKGCQAPFLDAQVMTPHLKALGATDISRPEFLKKLRAAQQSELRLF